MGFFRRVRRAMALGVSSLKAATHAFLQKALMRKNLTPWRPHHTIADDGACYVSSDIRARMAALITTLAIVTARRNSGVELFLRGMRKDETVKNSAQGRKTN